MVGAAFGLVRLNTASVERSTIHADVTRRSSKGGGDVSTDQAAANVVAVIHASNPGFVSGDGRSRSAYRYALTVRRDQFRR